MAVLLTTMAVFATVGVLLGALTRPWIGLMILVAITSVVAGAMFLPDAEDPDVYQEMSQANQALITAIFYGGPAFVGWVAGALMRLERQERLRPGDAP